MSLTTQTPNENFLKYLEGDQILSSTISCIMDFRENPPVFTTRTEDDEKLNQIHTSFEGYFKNRNDYARDSVQVQIFKYLEELIKKYFGERLNFTDGEKYILDEINKEKEAIKKEGNELPWGQNGIIITDSDLYFPDEYIQRYITYKQLHQYDMLSDFICDEFSKYVMTTLGYVVSMDLARLANKYDEYKDGVYFLVIIAEKYDSKYFDEDNQRGYIRDFDESRHEDWKKKMEEQDELAKSFYNSEKEDEESDEEDCKLVDDIGTKYLNYLKNNKDPYEKTWKEFKEEMGETSSVVSDIV